MPFQVNSVSFGIAPQSQMYVDLIEGTDHTGRPIYSATKNVDLVFDAMSVALYNQFSALTGTSLASIQLLSIDQAASYVTYSNAGINLIMKTRPSLEAGVTGKFTVTITGLLP
jgi:hypothetical protein